MKLRHYIPELDFSAVSSWITDERTHAMWCANRFSFPLTQENFGAVLHEHAIKFGECPFVATTDSGRTIGFFCISVNTETDAAMLKFVVLSPTIRGMGFGQEMIELAVKYAFGLAGADTVWLCVFAENTAARMCYESVGFTEISRDRNAFTYKDETWGRCNMEIRKENI